MNNWASSVPLKEVADVFNGKTPSKTEQRSEGHPVLKIRDVSELGRFRGNHASFVDPILAAKYSPKQVQDGDTLILNAAHNSDYVGSKTYRAEPPVFGALATGEWLIIRPSKDRLDAGFVHHWVTSKSTRLAIRSVVNGIHLYPKDVARLNIPLPPITEQRRIAAILDQADALRAKRREALAQLDNLTQSIFIEMFGDVTSNPKKLPKVSISSVAKISTGSTPSRTGGDFYGGAIPWVKTTEVNGEDIRSTEEQLTDSGFKAIRGKLHPIDSIIVAMYGQGQTRGRCSLLKIPASCNQACGVIYPTAAFLPKFMFHQIRLAYDELRALGRGGNQENMNLQLLGAFEVLLPSPEYQKSFVARVQAIDVVKANHQEALKELDALFASLKHRAYRGEL